MAVLDRPLDVDVLWTVVSDGLPAVEVLCESVLDEVSTLSVDNVSDFDTTWELLKETPEVESGKTGLGDISLDFVTVLTMGENIRSTELTESVGELENESILELDNSWEVVLTEDENDSTDEVDDGLTKIWENELDGVVIIDCDSEGWRELTDSDDKNGNDELELDKATEESGDKNELSIDTVGDFRNELVTTGLIVCVTTVLDCWLELETVTAELLGMLDGTDELGVIVCGSLEPDTDAGWEALEDSVCKLLENTLDVTGSSMVVVAVLSVCDTVADSVARMLLVVVSAVVELEVGYLICSSHFWPLNSGGQTQIK